MADTNGAVAQDHLVVFDGIWVSKAIHAKLAATAADFARSGVSFHIAPPGGGYRWNDMQTAMRNDYLAHKYQQAPYYLSPPPSPIPGAAGTSRHGFGLAVDVTTNATVSLRNQIMARNGWHLWSNSDPNHFEPNGVDVLKSPPESAFAGSASTPLDDSAPATPPPLDNPGVTMIAIGLTSIQAAFQMHDDGRLVYIYNDGTGGPAGLSAAQNKQAVNPEAKDWKGVYPYDVNTFAWTLWNFGRLDLTVAQIEADIASGKAKPGYTWMPRWLSGATVQPVLDLGELSATVVKAVTDAIAATPDPSADTVSKAVAAALAPSFAAIPAAVVKAEGSALANG